MKNTKRILSTLLAVIMMLGALAAVITVPAAADTQSVSRALESAEIKEYYLNTKFNTPEEKLYSKYMQWMYTDPTGRYELHADANTGEVACLDTATGSILFTNPYDIATIKTEANRYEALSQIIIVCENNMGNKETLNSFEDAALNEQIKVQQIKKGVRVEYTIGREDTKKLVPMEIMGTDFEEAILIPLQEAVERGEMTEFEYKTFENRWICHDIQNMKGYLRAEWLTQYPCLEKAYNENGVYPDLWIFRSNVSAADIQKTEDTIKKFTDYSYEELDAHHETTGYEATDAIEPAFKLALEYYVDENGMSVRLPCNGLRYDMANFKVESISILPFIGAGNYTQDGYAFLPDGSGALFDYETMQNKNFAVTGQVYGEDYAYHELINMKYERVVRYPVYGAVSTEKIYEYTYSQGGVMATKKVSATVMTPDEIMADLEKIGADLISSNFENPIEYKRGYMAIIEEGESLTKIKLEHGQSRHRYCTVRNNFKPLATDKNENGVPLQSRKYTGSLSIRFVILCNDDAAAIAKQTYPSYKYYSTSWVGMAKAYREYLDQIGVLDPLTEKDVKDDIPLYIESFGALETQETIATIPVYLMTPLTTFDNVLSMYNELSKNDVKNINFKMTGFANGGMYYKVPSALKWEKAVGGKDGFSELVNAAKKINKKNDGSSHLGLYPDFDFAYIQENTLFDAVHLKKDAIKTMDNRYTSYWQYSPTQQTFVTFYQLAISPSRYSKFYTKLLENYVQYGNKAISVASLGNILNSDFDEEEPYNREESKEFTTEALAYMAKKGYSIMTDGGNAYTWKYVDHILNVDLDSSRYLESSASVPFIGMVLHGYIQFAGSPLNEEGDANYAMLRAIENGSSLYFILSYQNTAELKNDPVLSQYYSIRYNIWVEDVIAYYTELNRALKDVQTKQIINHEFLIGERVVDLDELEKDIADKLQDAANAANTAQKNDYISGLVSVSDAWNLLYEAEGTMKSILKNVNGLNAKIAAARATCEANSDFDTVMQALNDAALALENADEEGKAAAQEAYDEALKAVMAQLQALYDATMLLLDYSVELAAYKDQSDDLVAAYPKAIELVENSYMYEDDEATRAMLLEQMNGYLAAAQPYFAQIADAYSVYANDLKLGDATGAFFSDAATAVKKVFVDNVYNVADLDALTNLCGGYIFDLDLLNLLYAAKTEKEDDKTQIGDNDNNGKIVVDNNRIVAVTYGTGDTAYKTFILNYNGFTVRVVYNGTIYTIESGDYVMITASANA